MSEKRFIQYANNAISDSIEIYDKLLRSIAVTLFESHFNRDCKEASKLKIKLNNTLHYMTQVFAFCEQPPSFSDDSVGQ